MLTLKRVVAPEGCLTFPEMVGSDDGSTYRGVIQNRRTHYCASGLFIVCGSLVLAVNKNGCNRFSCANADDWEIIYMVEVDAEISEV